MVNRERAEQIADRCPSCGGSTLIVSNGGWLVCGFIGCKDPTAIERVIAAGLPSLPPVQATTVVEVTDKECPPDCHCRSGVVQEAEPLKALVAEMREVAEKTGDRASRLRLERWAAALEGAATTKGQK